MLPRPRRLPRAKAPQPAQALAPSHSKLNPHIRACTPACLCVCADTPNMRTWAPQPACMRKHPRHAHARAPQPACVRQHTPHACVVPPACLRSGGSLPQQTPPPPPPIPTCLKATQQMRLSSDSRAALALQQCLCLPRNSSASAPKCDVLSQRMHLCMLCAHCFLPLFSHVHKQT